MQAELEALTIALGDPERPVAAIVGGAKVSTKLELLGNLIKKVEVLIIGGGMANTFLFAQGKDVGKSLCEKDMADKARSIMAEAQKAKCRIVLPVDAVVAKELKAHAHARVVDVDHVADDEMILDIGPKSVAAIEHILGQIKTLVWNGPFGAFETPPFEAATFAIAKTVGSLTKEGKLKAIAGGGDTVAALNEAGRRRPVHLCLGRRGRVPRMDGRQGASGRRGAAGEVIEKHRDASLPQLCWGRWREAPDGVWPAAPTQVGLHERRREPVSSHSCFPHPISPFGPPSPAWGRKGRRGSLSKAPALRQRSNVYNVSKLYTTPGAAPMRTNIEIDDKLMARAMRLTGLPTKRAAVEEGLRLLVRVREQAEALKALKGLGWEGDLDEMRQGRAPGRS